jgi:hypothetical protein
MPHFMVGKFTVAKSERGTLSTIFVLSYKKVILPKFANFLIPANVYFGVGRLCGYEGAFPLKEGGIQALADLAPTSQTLGSFLTGPKNLAKSFLANLFHLKNALDHF